jgi:hypothetical protein
MTGLSRGQLTDLVDRVREVVGPWENPPVGRPHVLSLPTAVVAVLFGLRHNMPDGVLAEVFGCSQATITRYHEILHPILRWVTRPEVDDQLEFDSFGPQMLVLADRNFLSWKLWRDAAATRAELVWRVSDSFTLPVLERLPDGSYLSRLNPPRKKDGEPITVRVIEYSVSTRDEYGATTSELFCLATTLLDPQVWPIEEFPDLYHERWRAETLLDAVKTDLRGGPDILTRSQSPDGTRQEIWALFCLYQALADLVGDAA